MLWTVYTISHPKTDCIVYVGITRGSVLKRFGQHLCGNKHNQALANWMLSFEDELLVPKLKIVAKLQEELHARLLEAYLINELKDQVFNKTCALKAIYPKKTQALIRKILDGQQILFQQSLDVEPDIVRKVNYAKIRASLEKEERVRELTQKVKNAKLVESNKLNGQDGLGPQTTKGLNATFVGSAPKD